MPQAKLPAIPLFFSFKQLVVGDGFIAGVRMNGRALLETDEVDGSEEAWITGIAPVGITGGGGDRGFAFVDFRKAWVEVLFDLAVKASSFEEFRASAEAFLGSTQDSITCLWEGAVKAVRENHYVDPALEPKNADEHPVQFDIVDLTGLNPGTEENETDRLGIAA